MGERNLTRRTAIRAGAAGLLGGVGVTGRVRGADLPNRIVVSNRAYDGDATYEFEVSGSVERSDSPWGDNADGSRAWGKVTGWKDGYRFSGEIVSFTHDGPVDVYLDGAEVDPATLGGGPDRHRIVVDGTGPTSRYEFTVSGEITGGEDLTGSDSYSGSTASGAVAGWSDTYDYTGEVTGLSVDGPARVYIDGSEVDPASLGGGTNWHRVVVSNRAYDGDATYEFEVSGSVERSDSPWGDNADGSRAWGKVTGWKDGYRFSGEIVSFTHDGPVDVSLDGAEVDPVTLGDGDGDGGSGGGTVRTRGTPLHDMDDWSAWSSTADNTRVTADGSVSYRGSTALRFDVSSGRLAARYDPESTLDLSGRRLSLAVKWAAPDQYVRLFLALVDADGARSSFTVSAPNGMSGPDQGWMRCPVAAELDGPNHADLTAVESIELSTWPLGSGRIWIDDVRVHDQPDRGRVAFTFDDAGASRRRAFDAMRRRGLPGTVFPIAGQVGMTGRLTLSDLNDAKDAGWTVGSHPQRGTSLAGMSGSEAAAAMDADRRWLRDHGFDPGVLAWPYGAFDTEALAAADERYDLAFGTDGSPSADQISTPMTAGRLKGNTPDGDGDGVPDLPKRAVDRAAEFGELVVLTYHDVDAGGQYSIPLDLLEGTLDYAVDADVDIVTCADLVPR